MSTLKDLLKDVPQGYKHHPEGDVWRHVRLVRQALPLAVEMFERARSEEGSPFSNFTPISKQDQDILRLSAWLHDIGKASATAYTNPDKSRTPLSDYQGKYTVQQMMAPEFGPGKWQSIGHEEPHHYEPLINQLGRQWRVMLEKMSPDDKSVLDFVIQHHMDFNTENGIHRKMQAEAIGEDGKFLPDRKYKLWIVFKLMDSMGRGGGADVASGERLLAQILGAAENKRRQQEERAKKQPPQDRDGFAAFLRQKGLSDEQVAQIVAKKFGSQ